MARKKSVDYKLQIGFSERQKIILETESKRFGITFTELVRRILDQYIENSIKKEVK